MILKEFQFLQCQNLSDKKSYLSPQTFDELEKFVLENEDTARYLKLSTVKGYGKVLIAQNYVGVLQTNDGTTIEILPKIANLTDDENGDKARKILIKMLKTLKKSPFEKFNKTSLKSTNLPLLEIFISMFLEELTRLVRKGIKSDYITKQDNLKFLKGKLLFGQQIKQNYIHKERFYVEYQNFLSDRVENRLIKTTLNYLYKKSQSNTNQQRIREFLFVFDEVSLSKEINKDFKQVKLNRQMKDYEQVLLWSKTFLLNNSFSPYKGKDIAYALLFDMNLLFESYVGEYFKKLGLDVMLQDCTHHLAYLDGRGKFLLKPDFVINKDNEKEIIADTKWKLLDDNKVHQGISQSDMYQLFAYGKKYRQNQLKNLYLIYPKIENNAPLRESCYQFNKSSEHMTMDLKILFFDLQNDLSPIEKFWE